MREIGGNDRGFVSVGERFVVSKYTNLLELKPFIGQIVTVKNIRSWERRSNGGIFEYNTYWTITLELPNGRLTSIDY